MSLEQQLDFVVADFARNFDRMCKYSGRAYMMRQTNSKKAEDAGKRVRYNVRYKMKKTNDGWEVFAQWGFWILSLHFPLLKIIRVSPAQIKFEGLFVKVSPTINANPAELQTALKNYLNYCRNLPENTFVNV